MLAVRACGCVADLAPHVADVRDLVVDTVPQCYYATASDDLSWEARGLFGTAEGQLGYGTPDDAFWVACLVAQMPELGIEPRRAPPALSFLGAWPWA